MALPTFADACRAGVDQYLLPAKSTAAKHATGGFAAAAVVGPCWDRQTDAQLSHRQPCHTALLRILCRQCKNT